MEFLGASTGAAVGHSGYVQANYLTDEGYSFNIKYIAILAEKQPSKRETAYAIYSLGPNTAVPMGFNVMINSYSGAAYVERDNTNLPVVLAQKFVNMITGKLCSLEESSEEWFEFNIEDGDYK